MEIMRRGLKMAPGEVRKSGLHCLSPVSIRFILLFESNISSIGEDITIKGSLLVKKNKEKILTYLELYTRQFCLVLTHLSQRLIPPILTTALCSTFLVASL